MTAYAKMKLAELREVTYARQEAIHRGANEGVLYMLNQEVRRLCKSINRSMARAGKTWEQIKAAQRGIGA